MVKESSIFIVLILFKVHQVLQLYFCDYKFKIKIYMS